MSPREAYPKSRAAIERALAIDEALPDVHAALAWVQAFYDNDWGGAKRSLDRALELDPDNARAHGTYSLWMLAMARFDDELDSARRAQELDPLSPVFTTLVGVAHYVDEQYEDARAEFQKALELEPSYLYANSYLGTAYVSEGKHEEAIAFARDWVERSEQRLRVGTARLRLHVFGSTGRGAPIFGTRHSTGQSICRQCLEGQGRYVCGIGGVGRNSEQLADAPRVCFSAGRSTFRRALGPRGPPGVGSDSPPFTRSRSVARSSSAGDPLLTRHVHSSGSQSHPRGYWQSGPASHHFLDRIILDPT